MAVHGEGAAVGCIAVLLRRISRLHLFIMPAMTPCWMSIVDLLTCSSAREKRGRLSKRFPCKIRLLPGLLNSPDGLKARTWKCSLTLVYEDLGQYPEQCQALPARSRMPRPGVLLNLGRAPMASKTRWIDDPSRRCSKVMSSLSKGLHPSCPGQGSSKRGVA